MAISKGIFGKGGGQNPEMGTDDQEFLKQIEQNIRSKDNEQDDARKEAEQRAREMERIRKASATQKIPGARPTQPAPAKPSSGLENDPRYREYFERLNRQKGGGATPTPAPAASPSATAQSRTSATPSQTIGPGSIVRFDDGSIGVYKDAVSGRDYALFYFLQPDGQFVPEGVFLQCYQARLIGSLPENYFNMLREQSEWDRDLILFHLSNFEHVDFLNNVAAHEERKPKNTTPAKNASLTPQPQSTSSDKPAEPRQTATPEPRNTSAPAELQAKSAVENASNSTEPQSNAPGGLQRGRKFQIKFGGKQWEAVYWTSDSEGSIVAHDTHGQWSLIRLDLDRFKDSLVPGELVDDETLKTIADDAVGSK